MEDEQKQAKIKVNGREILFPPRDVDMGEMCDAEDFFGVDWDQPKRSAMRLTAAFLWIAIKRIDDTVTIEDIRTLDPAVLKQLKNQLEGDQSPPESEPSEPVSSEPGEPSSTHDSDVSETDQNGTGDLGSDTGTTSDPVTLPA